MVELTLSRRKFLFLASSFMVISSAPSLATSVLSKMGPRFSSRKLSLYNVHSGEGFEGVYWRDGSYDEKALKRLAYLLRDRRNNKEHHFDARLFDVLHRLRATLDIQDSYNVICGYRSPQTNFSLRKKKRGVAKNSLHMKGKAIDLQLPNLPLKELCDAARSLKAGGVGYYPRSNFIHLDIRPKPAFWS